MQYYTQPALLEPNIIAVFRMNEAEPSGAYEEREPGLFTASNFSLKRSITTQDKQTAILYALSAHPKTKKAIQTIIQPTLF